MPVRDDLIDFCAVAMMQKDEGDVLRAWIDHYTSLFVADALAIFDNGSTDAETLAQLERAQALGVRVDRSRSTAADFIAKGDILLAHFAEVADRFEFFYPVDCDELMVCGDPADKTSSLLSNLRLEFGALRQSRAAMFRIVHEYRNAPGHPRFSRHETQKILLRKPLPKSMDRGFHYYDFVRRRDLLPGIEECAFRHIHFHKKPYHLQLKTARQKLKTLVPSFAPEVAGAYLGAGQHLSSLFTTTAEAYYEQARRRARTDLSAWLEGRGIRPPFSAPSHVLPDDDEQVIFYRRPVNAFAFAASSGLGEAVVALLEPLLWRAETYLEYADSRSATDLARAAGVTRILSIKARGIRQSRSGPVDDVEERLLLPVKLRTFVARYCAVPPKFHRPRAVLVVGPHRMAVLSTLYRDGATRICVPDFVDWQRRSEAEILFDVTETLGGAAVLSAKAGQHVMAEKLFDMYWRDVT
jgi:hypothetical protein